MAWSQRVELDLSECSTITSSAFTSVCEQLGNSQRRCFARLELSGCAGVTAALVEQLSAAGLLSGLSTLEANHVQCLEVSSRGWARLISQEQQVLGISGALGRAVRAAAQGLRVLCIDGAHLTDDVLEALGQAAPDLATLSMVGTTSVTDAGLASLARGCRGLRRLDIGGQGPWTEGGGLAKVTGLDSLSISRRDKSCVDADLIKVGVQRVVLY